MYSQQQQHQQPVSPKSRTITLILCIFLGWLGVHRFYVEKIGSGVLYLCTNGLFGIGVLVDFIVILTGGFRDNNGLLVYSWEGFTPSTQPVAVYQPPPQQQYQQPTYQQPQYSAAVNPAKKLKDAKYCPTCGSANELASIYCSSCGSDIQNV